MQPKLTIPIKDRDRLSCPNNDKPLVGGSGFHFVVAKNFFLEKVLLLFCLAIFALYSRIC